MKTHSSFRASIQNSLFRLMGVLVIAAFLAGGAFSAQPAGVALAAACGATDGKWSVTATWSCGHTPTSADDVIIHDSVTSAGVIIDVNASVDNLTINASGVLTFNASVSLNVSGNFNVDVLGVFDPGADIFGNASTVNFVGTNQTITTNGETVDFWNFAKTTSVADTLSFDPAVAGVGGIHILNDLMMKGTAPSAFLALRSTVPGSQWQIDPDFTREVDYVDVQDSDNIDPVDIDVVHGVDSGNNDGWNLAASAVELTSSKNPSLIDTDVTFTAIVMPDTATGTVDFIADGTAIASCTTVPLALVNGHPTATCTIDDLDAGEHDIVAVYISDDELTGSVSGILDQFVFDHIIFAPLIFRQ